MSLGALLNKREESLQAARRALERVSVGWTNTPLPPTREPRQFHENTYICRCIDNSWCVALIKELMEGFRALMKYFRAHVEVVDQFVDYLPYYLSHKTEIDLIKSAKWLCCLPMAKFCHEEVEVPVRHFNPPRAFKQWMRSHMKDTPRNAKLWFSWFQMKRCSPTVPAGFVMNQAEAHRRAMETPHLTTSKDDEEKIRAALSRLPRQFYADQHKEVYAPSFSACLEATRKDGGNRGLLRWLWKTREGRAGSESGSIPELVLPEGEGFVKDGEWCEDTYYRTERPGLDEEYFQFLLGQARTTFPEARVEFVLEPLKVRSITKGPTGLYSYCRYWQKFVHGQLRQLPEFRLLGKPVDTEDVLWCRGEERKGYEWVSIDYSAATDKLNAEFTVDALLTTLDPQWLKEFGDHADLLFDAAGPHLITYPPKLGIPAVYQQNGQLMGSPMSFPLLCKVNAATIRAADKEMGLSVKDHHFLVNGDDALVYRPEGWRKIHERLAASAGLSYSVGKVYVSRNYANVNSTGFWTSGATCTKLDYIPIGLMRGHHKVEETCDGIDGRTFGGVVGAARMTIAACSERPVYAFKKFINWNKEKLKSACGSRNLFVCTPQQGLGLNRPEGWKTSVTLKQQELANFCKVALTTDIDRAYRGPSLTIDPVFHVPSIRTDPWAPKPESNPVLRYGFRDQKTVLFGEQYILDPNKDVSRDQLDSDESQADMGSHSSNTQSGNKGLCSRQDESTILSFLERKVGSSGRPNDCTRAESEMNSLC